MVVRPVGSSAAGRLPSGPAVSRSPARRPDRPAAAGMGRTAGLAALSRRSSGRVESHLSRRRAHCSSPRLPSPRGGVMAADEPRRDLMLKMPKPVLRPPAAGVGRVDRDHRQTGARCHLGQAIPEPGGRDRRRQPPEASAPLARVGRRRECSRPSALAWQKSRFPITTARQPFALPCAAGPRWLSAGGRPGCRPAGPPVRGGDRPARPLGSLRRPAPSRRDGQRSRRRPAPGAGAARPGRPAWRGLWLAGGVDIPLVPIGLVADVVAERPAGGLGGHLVAPIGES